MKLNWIELNWIVCLFCHLRSQTSWGVPEPGSGSTGGFLALLTTLFMNYTTEFDNELEWIGFLQWTGLNLSTWWTIYLCERRMPRDRDTNKLNRTEMEMWNIPRRYLSLDVTMETGSEVDQSGMTSSRGTRTSVTWTHWSTSSRSTAAILVK